MKFGTKFIFKIHEKNEILASPMILTETQWFKTRRLEQYWGLKSSKYWYLQNNFNMYIWQSLWRLPSHPTLQFLQLDHKMSPIKVACYVLRVKICILDHPQTRKVHEARRSWATYITSLGEAQPSYVYQNSLQCFSTSLESVTSSSVC